MSKPSAAKVCGSTTPTVRGMSWFPYSHFLAGPYVGRCLAAPGAEAIKVERPGSKEPRNVYGRGHSKGGAHRTLLELPLLLGEETARAASA